MNLQLEVCKNHPETLAAWRCAGCAGLFCDACVKSIRVGPTSVRTCADCGERCESVTAAAEAAREEVKEKRDRNFFRRLPGAFIYPFRGTGVILLLIGGFFFGGFRFVRFLYSGVFGLLITVAVIGYLNAFMLSIINSTANGKDELPDWPGFTDFSTDIVHPYFLVLGVFAVSAFPLIAFIGSAWYFALGPAIVLPVGLALTGLAALYYPMGLLAVAMYDDASGLSPAVVFPAMFKAPAAYLVACVVLGLVLVLRGLSATLLAQIPVAGFLLDGLVSFYLIVVGMRILGLLYFANEERFGWFKDIG